jgi:1-acyl-sn-glycerol-3-phosphate acyltransferase
MNEPTQRPGGPLIWLCRFVLSLLGWSYMALSSALFFPIALAVWLVTLPFDRNLVVQHLFTCFWAVMYVWVHPGWRLRVEGRRKLPWRGPAIIVANHQSLVDALVMFALFRPFKPVSQAIVRWAPFIGWNMMLNRYILLERGDRASIAQMAEACRYWLRRGAPVMIYPEGTRSADGEIKSFQNGAFKLAVEENCPVYPVVIDGTRDALPRKSLLLSLNARMIARVLDPVLPAAKEATSSEVHARDRAIELRDRVRQLMIEELNRMRKSQAPNNSQTDPNSAGAPAGGAAQSHVA